MIEFETAQDRLARAKKVNALIVGPPGIGKTHAARTLGADDTLFIDCEAGTLSLEQSKDHAAWLGTTVSIRQQSLKMNVHPWEMCRAIACVLAGPDPAAPNGPYSAIMHGNYVQMLCGGDANKFAKFKNYFVDSATVASRWAFQWACLQPECISQKTGKLDKLNAYGLMGQEMVNWATQLQHAPQNIFMSCILETENDEFNRKLFKLQMEGRAAAEKLPGIFDLVMSLAWVEFEGQGKHRVFVTQENNPHGFPAKDRSGLLEPYEKPDLGYIIQKIQAGGTVNQQPQNAA